MSLHPLVIDLTNQKFNLLTPFEYIGNSKWRCICDCGNITIACGKDLRNGKHKSCGCLQSDEDLSGKKFIRLTAYTLIKEADKHGRLWAKWKCACDCGNEIIVLARSLKAGDTKSCGCLNTEKKTKHGQCRTSEYGIWGNMLQRCYNPKTKNYHNYGERGITVCQEWHDFKNFIRDMGKRPSNQHSIDRKDNNGNYNKNNCHWATREEQNRNKRTNRNITIDGETKIITDWCNQFGQQVAVVRQRLKRGLTIKEALHVIS